MMDLVVVLCGTGSILCIVLAIRALAVYSHLRHMLGRVSTAARRDIRADRPWEWRYKRFGEFHQIQGRMTLMFWKPLDSFIPDAETFAPKE